MASLSSPQFDANPFSVASDNVADLPAEPMSKTGRIDGVGAAVMRICRYIESKLALMIRPEMRFDDGHV
jgi:hypothetical protein